MIQWHFYDKVYRRWLVLMLGSLTDLKEEMKTIKYKEIDDLHDAKGMCIELGGYNNDSGQNCTIIWLKEWETATLVHEITHFVMMAFDQVGVPISRDNTESFAFYSEYWFNEIMRTRRRLPNGRTSTQARKST
jgi:hypothetical protein